MVTLPHFPIFTGQVSPVIHVPIVPIKHFGSTFEGTTGSENGAPATDGKDMMYGNGGL